DDARPCGVHVDTEAVTSALDLHTAHGRPLELAHQVVADAPVLDQVVGVLPVREPARLPVGGNTEAEAVGVDLLAHYLSCSLSSAAASGSASASGSGAGAATSASAVSPVAGATSVPSTASSATSSISSTGAASL